MITAADYSDWTYLAGLYLRNLSNADRYRTFERELSPAGLTVKIVHDFLRGNAGGIDLTRWRRSEVYEMGEDARWRIERTARALETVGAPRAAAGVRTVEDTSIGAIFLKHAEGGGGLADFLKEAKGLDLPAAIETLRGDLARAMPDLAAKAGIPAPDRPPAPPDPAIESREQIEHLLERFVTSHQRDLERDLARHGDPRREPGFTREGRDRELDRLRRRLFDRETQQEQAVELGQVLTELRTSLEKNPAASPAKHRSAIRAIAKGIKTYSGRDPGDLMPEMGRWLARATRFVAQHGALFRPAVTDDASLLARLEALGGYEVDQAKTSVTLTWDAPVGLECDWATLSLEISVPPKEDEALSRTLGTIDRLIGRWPEHRERLRAEVLESFELYADQLHDFQTEDYERDDEGNVTQSAILAHCGGGQLCIDATEQFGETGIRVHFGIEWDDEHGLDLSLDDLPEEGAR